MNYPQQLPLADQSAPSQTAQTHAPAQQISYQVIRIGMYAFVLWMVYLAVNGALKFLSQLSWDMIGIGLALLIPVSYTIACARRERYGDHGDGVPTSF